MAYYPKSQVTINLYTSGNEYVVERTNQPYTGEYYATSKGKFFAGANPTIGGDKVRLIKTDTLTFGNTTLPVEPTKNPNNTLLKSFSTEKLYLQFEYPKNLNYQQRQLPSSYSNNYPLPSEIINGFYPRYFVKKTNEIQYLEVSKSTYNKMLNKDNSITFELYELTSIDWSVNDPSLNNSSIRKILEENKWPSFSEWALKNTLSNNSTSTPIPRKPLSKSKSKYKPILETQSQEIGGPTSGGTPLGGGTSGGGGGGY